MQKYHLLLGSNIDDRVGHLKKAIKLIRESNIHITSISSVYETEPWGYDNQEFFLNVALIIECTLNPHSLLKILKEIESNIGRKDNVKWGNRIIDIDIIYNENQIISSDDLIIPHHYRHERNFVLLPLMEIDPYFKDPILHLTIEEMYDLCRDIKEVYLSEHLIA